MNTFYLANNLPILQKLKTNSIDAIITDPPFNSGVDYFTSKLKLSGKKVFTDIWQKDESFFEVREQIKTKANSDPNYEKLNNLLIGYDLIFKASLDKNKESLQAYLAFLSIRLIEMYRILKNTGSFYLHCDATASHYLKVILDTIFGKANFKREIIWAFQRASGYKTIANNWIRNHDTILYYTKSNDFVFNKQYEDYEEDYIKSFKHLDEKGPFKWVNKKKRYLGKGHPLTSVWTDCSSFQSHKIAIKEGTGYPTQKPFNLYERIVLSCTNETDLILDPFCGSGTILDVAQYYKRKWIGIDISKVSFKIVKARLFKHYLLQPEIHYLVLNEVL